MKQTIVLPQEAKGISITLDFSSMDTETLNSVWFALLNEMGHRKELNVSRSPTEGRAANREAVKE